MMKEPGEKSLKERYADVGKDAFVREVGEAARMDRVARVWHRYKYYVMSAAALVLGVSVAISVMEGRKASESVDQARRFERIMSNGAVSDEGKILELEDFAANADYGYRDIARFHIYNLQMAAGKTADGIETLKAVIANPSDSEFGNLAVIKIALIPDFVRTDEGFEYSVKRLRKIGKGKPFHHTALMASALLYMQRKDYAAADGSIAELLSDPGAPAEIKNKALALGDYIKSLKSKK